MTTILKSMAIQIANVVLNKVYKPHQKINSFKGQQLENKLLYRFVIYKGFG